jgi:hypothetical protein
VTPRRVVIEEPVSLSLGRYLGDPAGLREVLEAIDGLAEDPRPLPRSPGGLRMAGCMSAGTGWSMRSALT